MFGRAWERVTRARGRGREGKGEGMKEGVGG